MLIHLPHAVKSIDLFTDLLQWIISTQGLHTAAPAWIGARGALHMNKKGVRSFWSSQERLRMLLGRTQPLSCIWGVSWLENTFNLQNSSPGMEFLLNRATISSYGHCGLTSTSWGKKNFPPHSLAGQLQDTGTKTCSSFTNFASGQSCTQSTWSGGKIPPCTEWLGRKLITTNLLE